MGSHDRPEHGRHVSVDWSAVYTDTYQDLHRFLNGKVWDPERAHDLAQETFVRALRHEPDNPRAWLFSVAANLARDEARSAVRRKHHLQLLKSEVESAEAVEADAPRRMERDERSEDVAQALGRLSERDREVLLLWNAGSSYQEISEQTGLAVGAIGTTLARARRRLVAEYEGLENDAARDRG
ncbi:MAG: sigma-70 family RNA polymerase sigma factor [Gemmatimonadota bacterium]|nr:sigma-70 family RNA polymerase sigma factor [Gemmatimonadota bacterium]